MSRNVQRIGGSSLGDVTTGFRIVWPWEEPHRRKLESTEVTAVTVLPWLCALPMAAEGRQAVCCQNRILTSGIT